MNRQHLGAFLWLRWRLMVNQWRRAGRANAVLTMIFVVGAMVLAGPLFLASFAAGLFALPKAAPVHLLYVWDGVTVAFVVVWGLGVLSELQRTDAFMLSKFLHLPVSVNGAFLINYLSSLPSFSMIIFLPVMLGLGLGLVFAKGVWLLPVLPLTAAFLLMVTALTYQFQGWLASLMSNPRRRRAVLVAAGAIFVLILQLPNLLNIVRPWGAPRQAQPAVRLQERLAELDRAFKSQQLDGPDYTRRSQEAMRKYELERKQASQESAERWKQTATLVNVALPIGWLPLGVMAAAEGNALSAMLGFLGMTLIGAASLWRAYRTTIRLYQGQFTARRRPAPAVASPQSARKPGVPLVQRRIPGLPEPAAAIAVAGLRSLMRSPEAKMMLVMPVVLGAVFGSMLLKLPGSVPELIRPLITVGAMVMVLLGMLQLMANQFGFDRDGFRMFVLSPAPRRDILLGKNLSFFPLAFGLVAIVLVVVQVVRPLRLDHLLAMLPQFVTMYLLFCILMNWLSIYAPMHVSAGSLKPQNPKLAAILLQMLVGTFLFPLVQVPTLLPLGIEAALEAQGLTTGAPICLLGSLAECAAVIVLYRIALNGQGRWLAAREQRILESITSRAS